MSTGMITFVYISKATCRNNAARNIGRRLNMRTRKQDAEEQRAADNIAPF